MERAKEKEQPMYVGVDMVKAARWERICEKFPSHLEKMFTEEERAHCESKGKIRLILTRRSGQRGKQQGKHWDRHPRFRFWRCVPVMDKVGGACSPLAGEF